MKKIMISVLVILTLTLTGCGAASNGTQQAASTQQGESLPIQEQVLIGTFKLEGTPQAVTAQQAAQLLPLWQVYKDLSSSDTAAQEEIDGLIQQIQDTMTPEQMQAIAAMNITRQDIFTVMQDQGITQARGQGQSSGSRSNGQNGNGGGFGPPMAGLQEASTVGEEGWFWRRAGRWILHPRADCHGPGSPRTGWR